MIQTFSRPIAFQDKRVQTLGTMRHEIKSFGLDWLSRPTVSCQYFDSEMLQQVTVVTRHDGIKY